MVTEDTATVRPPAAAAAGPRFLGIDNRFLPPILITSILLRELEGTGTISLRRFYRRRGRRLVPPSLLTITVVAVGWSRSPLAVTDGWVWTQLLVVALFASGLGGAALAEMLSSNASAAPSAAVDRGILGASHFAPKAKRIIYLFMSGAPSQLDLFDYKPLLNQRHGEQLPDSVRGGQRLTGMSGNQSSIPLVGSPFKFTKHGRGGTEFSELLPHTAGIADDLCVVRSMFTVCWGICPRR